MKQVWTLSLVLGIAACSGPHARVRPGPVALSGQPRSLTPPELKLPTQVRPTGYAAELAVDPEQSTFHGVATLQVEVDSPTDVVWLNAQDLSLFSADVSVGNQRWAAEILPQPRSFVGLRFPTVLPKGPARLRIEYSGNLSDKEYGGATRQEEDGHWYVYSDFEPIDARRVFPSFDEPAYKIPWQLSLVVPTQDAAFSNTPEEKTVVVDPHHKRVTFQQTQPLPSYLVAFAVGPIDVVDAGRSRVSGTPVRILVPRGHAKEARFAAANTAEILAQLEDYFGLHYPYAKLDLIAMPQGTGAMENAGLVTFVQHLLLSPPEQESIHFRRIVATYTAHELAHQWFGDYVTLAWWDDIWLNEAFAEWMMTRVMDGWQPSWGANEERVVDSARAFETDALLSSRSVRQPIQTENDIVNVFDGITYQKGAAVIRSFEQWVGPKVFQRGVHQYLQAHAFKSSNASEFLRAISAEAGRDVGPAFSTFLDQPGVPMLTAQLSCEKEGPHLALSQERYRPSAVSFPPSAAAQQWEMPVCVRWGVGAQQGRDCTLLTAKTGTLPLSAPGCPDWVVSNAGQDGYYQVAYTPKELQRLFPVGRPSPLTSAEKIGVLNELGALAAAGKLTVADALAVLPRLKTERNEYVVGTMVDQVAMLRRADLIPPSLEKAYARLVRSLFGERARTLGWKPKPGEDEKTRALRASIVPLVAGEGDDPVLARSAGVLADAWMAEHTAVSPDLVNAVLRVAAAKGDLRLFNRMHAAALKEKDPVQRDRLLRAMTQFQDAAAVKAALALVLARDFDPREATTLVWAGAASPKSRALPYDFMKAHFEEILSHLPQRQLAFLPFLGSAQCEARYEGDLKSFFQGRISQVEGGPRMLSQALESLNTCVAFKKAQAASVAKFLGNP